MGVAIGCGVLGTAATIAQMTLLSRVVARAFLHHQSVSMLLPLVWLLVAAVVVRALFSMARQVVAHEAGMAASHDARARLDDHLFRLGPAYAAGERSGELAETATTGVERLEPYVAGYLPAAALAVIVPVLILAYVLPLDPLSGVLLLVTGPVIPLLMILVGSYAQEYADRQWAALTRLSAHFLDAVQGLQTLVLFNQGAAESARLDRVGDEFRRRTMQVLRLAFLSSAVLELISSLAIALIAVTLGIRLLNGGLAFERAFLVLLLAPEFYRPLRELGAQRHAKLEGAPVAARIDEICAVPVAVSGALGDVAMTPDVLDLQGDAGSGLKPPAWREMNLPSAASGLTDLSPRRLGAIPDGLQSEGSRRETSLLSIRISGVAYTYPGNERPALSDLSVTIPAGESVAVVGPSGAGKSTLVALLLRFIDPQVGEIMTGETPLTHISPDVWRAGVAYVAQRPHLFYGTVRENILLGRPEADDEEITRAALSAGALDFIQSLPQGFETPIGERGARLSAGQAQRIAIARAFLKDSPLLILDEPTAHLDAENDALVRVALERLMEGRTTVMVAHRRAGLERVDRVIRLEQGRMVEDGEGYGRSEPGCLRSRPMGPATAWDGSEPARRQIQSAALVAWQRTRLRSEDEGHGASGQAPGMSSVHSYEPPSWTEERAAP